VAESTDISDRTRSVALPTAFLLGVFGAHRFYVGKTGTGLLMLGTFGGLGMWWLYDLILILAGEFRDADGRRVVKWSVEEGEPRHLPGEVSDAVAEEMEVLRAELRTEMTELGERVDFLERLLTQARDRGALPPG
jgi:hypothetical protein